MKNKEKRGGSRPGSGRKPGRTRLVIQFSLREETVQTLRKHVPSSERSAFVDAAILSHIEKSISTT
jgi:hypothetical protein